MLLRISNNLRGLVLNVKFYNLLLLIRIMRQALLDTSFIMTCIKQKIDFFTYLEEEGFQVLIPTQVITELEGLANSQSSAKSALKILLEKSFIKIDLKSNNVDNGIITYANKNSKTIIATLDREIKHSVRNKKLIIKDKKMLEIL